MTVEQKHQRWQEVTAWCEQLDPRSPVDPGIKETVIALNILDIPTVMSCEGHLHGPFAPWIKIAAPDFYEKRKRIKQVQNWLEQQPETDETRRVVEYMEQQKSVTIREHLTIRRRLYDYLAHFYQERCVPYERRLVLSGGDGITSLGSQGDVLMEILPLEERRERLLAYQDEMRAFTAFLKQLYFSSEDEG
ncbi:hypothetical protein KSF_039760 [Reticulibacter mediterranei]|uniref:Uncharacterized protein n=1 Tax=Reticulibacter mediterranei TaxID=2778369 RepID=A0A8J3IK55_9CHLR|nr:hypothetical protein [Reticulibacter mediterranei]GHO93928.1 hypothetical protein KSF_039760 [Reticulibacter mediterranei]